MSPDESFKAQMRLCQNISDRLFSLHKVLQMKLLETDTLIIEVPHSKLRKVGMWPPDSGHFSARSVVRSDDVIIDTQIAGSITRYLKGLQHYNISWADRGELTIKGKPASWSTGVKRDTPIGIDIDETRPYKILEKAQGSVTWIDSIKITHSQLRLAEKTLARLNFDLVTSTTPYPANMYMGLIAYRELTGVGPRARGKMLAPAIKGASSLFDYPWQIPDDLKSAASNAGPAFEALVKAGVGRSRSKDNELLDQWIVYEALMTKTESLPNMDGAQFMTADQGIIRPLFEKFSPDFRGTIPKSFEQDFPNGFDAIVPIGDGKTRRLRVLPMDVPIDNSSRPIVLDLRKEPYPFH